MENEHGLEQLKTKLESEIKRLAQNHPNIVNPIEQEIDRPMEKEERVTKIGKKTDTYTVYQPISNLFYTKAEPQDRIANMLSVCLKFIEKPSYSDGLQGKLERFRDRKILAENESLSKRIRAWIKENQKEDIDIPWQFISMPMLQHRVEGVKFASFFGELGKVVFDGIEQGISIEETVTVLEKFKVTMPLIGTTELKGEL